MMQYIDLFSHRTVRLPSVVLSHQHDAAVCNPAPADGKGAMLARVNASLSHSGNRPHHPHRRVVQTVRPAATGSVHHPPFFCMMIQVTTYLKGLFSPASFLMQFSKHADVHWLTCASAGWGGLKSRVCGFEARLESSMPLSRSTQGSPQPACMHACAHARKPARARTRASVYWLFCSTASMDSLMMLDTSSATKAFCGCLQQVRVCVCACACAHVR